MRADYIVKETEPRYENGDAFLDVPPKDAPKAPLPTKNHQWPPSIPKRKPFALTIPSGSLAQNP